MSKLQIFLLLVFILLSGYAIKTNQNLDRVTFLLNTCIEAPEVFQAPKREAFIDNESFYQALMRYYMNGNWAS